MSITHPHFPALSSLSGPCHSLSAILVTSTVLSSVWWSLALPGTPWSGCCRNKKHTGFVCDCLSFRGWAGWSGSAGIFLSSQLRKAAVMSDVKQSLQRSFPAALRWEPAQQGALRDFLSHPAFLSAGPFPSSGVQVSQALLQVPCGWQWLHQQLCRF